MTAVHTAMRVFSKDQITVSVKGFIAGTTGSKKEKKEQKEAKPTHG
jgi:hypothetical protein